MEKKENRGELTGHDAGEFLSCYCHVCNSIAASFSCKYLGLIVFIYFHSLSHTLSVFSCVVLCNYRGCLAVNALVIDGAFLFSASDDHTIRMWEPNLQLCLAVLTGKIFNIGIMRIFIYVIYRYTKPHMRACTALMLAQNTAMRHIL